jgi:polysaccharide export outer membrane protein
MRWILFMIGCGFLLPLLFSCANPRRATYFNDLPDSTVLFVPEPRESVIRRNDIISITVSGASIEASRIFNQPNNPNVQSTTPTGETIQPAGYLVDASGLIRFPQLGSVRAEGLTTRQLEESIRTAILQRKLLVDPVVEVRFLNFKVTVLGEVTRPTVITVTNDKITLLEALGLAGDATIFAKRNNVLVIRQDSIGRKEIKRLDLTSTDLFRSPYYYLRSNDIVYMEPNRARVASGTRFVQFLPALISGFSALIIVIDRIAR